MGLDFDRKGYIEATSFAVTSGPNGGLVALLKLSDSRAVMIPFGSSGTSEDMLPSEVLSAVPELVLRVTLEEIAPWGITSEIHIEQGAGSRHFSCSGPQAFAFAMTRRCSLFVRRSLLHAEGVQVTGESQEDAFDAVIDWIQPVREPVSIESGFDENPIVRVVNTVIRRAIGEGASEVLIEPSGADISVKYLVQESWREEMTLPRHIQAPLTAQMKSLAELSPSVRTEPQDGWIPIKFESRRYDIALRSVPSSYGENFEMRIFAL